MQKRNIFYLGGEPLVLHRLLASNGIAVKSKYSYLNVFRYFNVCNNNQRWFTSTSARRDGSLLGDSLWLSRSMRSLSGNYDDNKIMMMMMRLFSCRQS